MVHCPLKPQTLLSVFNTLNHYNADFSLLVKPKLLHPTQGCWRNSEQNIITVINLTDFN